MDPGQEQSALGPHCLQKWLLKSQAHEKADGNCCVWQFKGWMGWLCLLYCPYSSFKFDFLKGQNLIPMRAERKQSGFWTNLNFPLLPAAICNNYNVKKYMSEDTQEMQQLRSTAFPRHQQKERRETNKDNTNVAHVYRDAQTKNCNRRTSSERLAGKKYWVGVVGLDGGGGGANHTYWRKTLPPIPMHLRITNICLTKS